MGSVLMQKNNIASYAVVESLQDGRQVTIRAIRADDKGPSPCTAGRSRQSGT
jgi:hypothetical protein